MKIFFKRILFILIFLAVSSGISKIILMQQDVDFFGPYGFTNPILIIYGAFQLLGGILLIVRKTRITGATFVAITFIISVVVLFMAGDIPVAIVTIIFVLLLGFIVKQSFSKVEA
jgi:hypothetical protein